MPLMVEPSLPNTRISVKLAHNPRGPCTLLPPLSMRRVIALGLWMLPCDVCCFGLGCDEAGDQIGHQC